MSALLYKMLPGALAVALLLAACGQPDESPQVRLPVVAEGAEARSTETNFGYRVELQEARAVLEDITFTTSGEMHAEGLWPSVADVLLPSAHAHPGHHQDGDVTGELRGRFVLDWLTSEAVEVGTATLLAGEYRSANFGFAVGSQEDGLAETDPLLGHTAVLRGHASKGDEDFEFTCRLKSPQDRELVGAPFEFTAKESSTETLGLRLLLKDPLEGDTLFDGIDFAQLSKDEAGRVVIEPTSSIETNSDAYNLLRRRFQTHDHFDVVPVSESH